MVTSTARITLLFAAMLGTSVALAAQRTYDKALAAPPGGRLTFDTAVGSVAVIGHDAPEVVIHAELQGPQSFLDQIRISAEQTPSGVAISAHGGFGSGWLSGLHWLSGGERVQFTIEVPRSYPLDLRTSGGSVQVRDSNASVQAKTSGGSALVQNVAGTLGVHTSGGSIKVEHLAGPAQLSSSGGGVDVTDSAGDLDLNSEGGGIRLLDDDGKIRAASSGGSIWAELRLNRGIRLDSSGGGITLLLPQDTHASIEATSDGGGLKCGFPLSTSQIDGDNHLVGAIGGGGPQISLRSSGGGIQVAPDK